MADYKLNLEPATLRMTAEPVTVHHYPGDTTIGFVLAFFALIETPSLTFVAIICDRLKLDLLNSFLLITLVTLGLALIFFKTSPGVKMVYKIVEWMKRMEIKP